MNLFAASTLLSGCVIACANAQATPPEAPIAYITSERVVYGYGQPIDVTFSINVPKDGSVLPALKVVDEAGETVESRDVNGRFFWETPGKAIDGKQRPGAIPAGRQHTETIADLREWYQIDAPGTYRVRFDGMWTPEPDGDALAEPKPVASNTLVIRIARPASDDEPWGEPTEGHIIPLEEIWALEMPGTKPMDRGRRSLEPQDFVAPEGEFLHEIVLFFHSNEGIRSPVSTGFIVRGSGIDALRRTHSVLVEKQKPAHVFQHGEKVTLVFFTKSVSRPIHIKHIENHGPVINISYEVVPHDGLPSPAINTVHLALIPLQLNHTGTVHVEMKPILQGRMLAPTWGEHLRNRVAQSFQFQVSK